MEKGIEIDKAEGPGARAGEPEEVHLVLFLLAGCEAALEIRKVREIIRVPEIARMPKAPPSLAGILNLRGRIIPVFDLKKRFGMPLIDRTEESRVLVAEIGDQVLGFLVDKVAGVLKLQPSLLQPADGPVLNIGAEFIEGVAAWADRLVLLLRLEKLLSIGESKALPEGDSAPPGEGKGIGH